MFKKFFKKDKKENSKDKNVLIIALLIHAAKIDDNYSQKEKEIIMCVPFVTNCLKRME